MKTLLAIALSAVFAATFATSTFAQCGFDHESASVAELKPTADRDKSKIAMSTSDPVKLSALLDTKKPVDAAKTSD